MIFGINNSDARAIEAQYILANRFLTAAEPRAFASQTYAAGETIVQSGQLSDLALRNDPAFNYCPVPFGLITRGSITVYENGVGVRTLGVGDAVGGFETAHWLNTGRSRKIGDWTLVGNEEVWIAFFGREMLHRSSDGVNTAVARLIINTAIADHVPQPVTQLPLLDWTASGTTSGLLPDTAIVVHSHLLPTNAALMRHLAHLVGKRNLFVLEKPYSTIPAVYRQLSKAGINVIPVPLDRARDYSDARERSIAVLWRKVVEAASRRSFHRLIVHDDGGDLWATLPAAQLKGIQIAGVEQTQRGIARFKSTTLPLPPIVSVASSGIKKVVKSAFIARGVLDRLANGGHMTGAARIGVIGMGSIGSAIFGELGKAGRAPLCYDSERPAPVAPEAFRSSIDALINDADLIIGCTGVDILRGVTLDRISGTKVFANAASANIEFRGLLDWADGTAPPFADLKVAPHDRLRCILLNGGFPVNFDREREWEAPEDIALTRCLIYAGIMQAVSLLGSGARPRGFVALDTTAQEHILARWVAMKDEAGMEVDAAFRNIPAIARAGFMEGLAQGPSCWLGERTAGRLNLKPGPQNG